MKIRKYFAANIRHALDMAREEQGPDVVILANRKVLGGVELVAAEDYDESLFTDDDAISVHRPDGNPGAAKNRQRIQSGFADATMDEQPGRSATQQMWTREPLLDQMRSEILSLRNLLEQQMSGLAWGAIGHQHPLWASLLRKLGSLGLSPELARTLVEEIPEQSDFEQAWRTVLALLSYRIPLNGDKFLTPGKAIAFVGPSGAGKTTTIAKLATNHVLEHGAGSVMLATTDAYRVGAREQIRGYGRILGVPVRLINTPAELNALLDQSGGRKLILIDTGGLSPKDTRHSDQLDILRTACGRMQTCLVLSATEQAEGLSHAVDAFSSLQPSCSIPCKLDEASSLGPVLSIVIEQALSVAFFCDGQRVPNDLHPLESHTLVSRAISVMKRNSTESSEDLLEQRFGKYEFKHSLGGRHEH